ncbi:MAG: sigma-E processing peptidase SpoIIGA [Clostridia bacterium]|nr:sigma-E processing peptidase SpoIIGA [Clostridia bacterium]
MHKVYLDVLFIQNIIMNYIILWSVKKLMKIRTSDIRLIAASALGGVYAIFALYPNFELLMNAPTKFILSLLMVLIAFSTHNLSEYFKVLGVFYLMTFVFGGAAFGLFYFTNVGIVLKNGIFYIHSFPFKLLMVSSIFAWLIVKYSWIHIKKKRLKGNFLMDIIIYFDQKQVALVALLDTGNSLSDPLSDLPVIVVEFEKMRDLIPQDIQLIYEDNNQDDLEKVTDIIANSQWVWRFRMIPFSSLGSKNAMLIGFKPDKVRMMYKDKKKDIKDIIIAIYNGKLSSDYSYSGLLHPEILD